MKTFINQLKEITDQKERELRELQNKLLMCTDDYEKLRLQTKIDNLQKVNGNAYK